MATAALSWITPPGSLANMLANVPVSTTVQAIDLANNGSTLTYKVIGGSLPAGLTMDIHGVISGTPTTTQYVTTSKYSFVVRVISSNGYVLDGGFDIILSNTVNNDFAWVTSAGSLGTIPAGEFYSLPLVAQNPQNVPITYKLLSGELPAGMRIISKQTTANITVTTQTISNMLPLTSTKYIEVGYFVAGPNIVAGTTVASVNPANNTITLSTLPTGTFAYGTAFNFYSPGLLQGVPEFITPLTASVGTVTSPSQIQTYKFTVRATTTNGHIIDRTFEVSLTNISAPIIEPPAQFLGMKFDGSYFSKQLTVAELNPNVKIDWTIQSGELPAGINLDPVTGLLSGYIMPLQLVGAFGPANYDGSATQNGSIVRAEYDGSPYEFNQLNQTLNYSFTVQAFDGANYATQKYSMQVVGRSGWTADDTNISVNDTYLTVDENDVYVPVLLNTVTTLPTGRQNTYYAYKFTGTDFSGNVITYSVPSVAGTFDCYVNTTTVKDLGFDSLWLDAYNGVITPIRPGGIGSFDSFGAGPGAPQDLPGLILDATTGWLYGKLNSQTPAIQNYEFGVQVSKTVGNVTYSSKPMFFTLPVLGDVNNVIDWITPSVLEPINNGAVSELSVSAVSMAGLPLTYSLLNAPGVSARLPQGLKLLPTGVISGRASFEVFAIDEGTTTFDGGKLTIDRISTFSVVAQTVDGSASSTRQFSIALNVIDQNPYENLYLNALLPTDMRKIYSTIINNTEIFDANVIYRQSDPWFGVNKNLDMLFLPGLTSEDLNAYEVAIAKNHWTKTFNFGAIKTAVVLDETYNVKYEVVYIDMIDPAQESITKAPPLEVNLNGIIANPYVNAQGQMFKIIYPNASADMIARLVSGVGYYDQSSLPDWMTSNQINPNNAATFNPPLGYTQAVVLAYTIPGAAELVAYRLRTAGINFQNIIFSIDRYSVDNYYSTNFKTVNRFTVDKGLTVLDSNKSTIDKILITQSWDLGKETTFDALPRKNVGAIVADVTYAVNVPFDSIDGRSVDYINANGGIDGVTKFTTGQTVVFVQQEHFLPPISYDGWLDYADGFIGTSIYGTSSGYGGPGGTVIVNGQAISYYGIPGLDTYDQYTVVPGFLEKASGTAPVNMRGGVWQINISPTNMVTLTFVKEVVLNQRIQVLEGQTYNGAILYYILPNVPGKTVPSYSVFLLNKESVVPAATTFNAGTTKFISKRDTYYTPVSQGEYLRFPQTGPFP